MNKNTTQPDPDPDMPADQMRLHFGEMTAQEMRTARAAIRFANTFNAFKTKEPSTSQPEPEPEQLNDQLSPRFLAQQIIFSFLKVDPTMSLSAAVALLMVYQAHETKTPIQTSDLSKELSLSGSTTTRLMAYLGEGKEDVGFNGLGLVDLQIDKKDRRLPIT